MSTLPSALDVANWLNEQGVCENIVFTKDVFIFEESNTLWKNYTKEEFSTYFFVEVVESLMKKFARDPHNKTMLDNTIKLQLVSFRKSVLVEVLKLKYDPSFPKKLNKKDHLLPVLFNKVVDLNTGEVRPRTKEDFFTKACNVVWNPKADSTFILNFLNGITCTDKDLQNLLQKTFRSLLTGNEIKGLYIVGNGNNGKSCLISLFASIMGPFCIKLPTINRDTHSNYKETPSFPSLPLGIDLSVFRVVLCQEEHYDISTKQIIDATYPPENLPEGFVVVNLKAKFVHNPSEENEYLIDPYMYERLSIAENKSAFLNWCLGN